MKRFTLSNDAENDYPQIMFFFYLENQQDLGKFISENYKGNQSEISRIPIRTWFLYIVDDRGDNTNDYIETLTEVKETMIEQMLACSHILSGLKQADNY